MQARESEGRGGMVACGRRAKQAAGLGTDSDEKIWSIEKSFKKSFDLHIVSSTTDFFLIDQGLFKDLSRTKFFHLNRVPVPLLSSHICVLPSRFRRRAVAAR